MLTAFARAFRTPDLRRKLLFTMGIMAIFRLGSFIPTPGVSYGAVQQCINLTRGSNNGSAGLYQINLEVPDGTPADAQIEVTAGGPPPCPGMRRQRTGSPR